jgi:hypothetical protein
MHRDQISRLIDESPMNRGLAGAAWAADSRNVAAVSGEEDVILFDYERPGVYQFHWLKSSRGRGAIEHAKRALTDMLARPQVDAIYGLVPVDRRDVRLMARYIGAKLVGETRDEYGEYQIFILTAGLQ